MASPPPRIDPVISYSLRSGGRSAYHDGLQSPGLPAFEQFHDILSGDRLHPRAIEHLAVAGNIPDSKNVDGLSACDRVDNDILQQIPSTVILAVIQLEARTPFFPISCQGRGKSARADGAVSETYKLG